MKTKDLTIAIVGATGAVGKVMLEILSERRFPFSELRLFASPRSVGRELKCGDHLSKCRVLEKGAFAGVDFAFFDASDEISREWVPEARSSGACVIDNSGSFRMGDEIPLIVPEVNGKMIKGISRKGALISGPNCTTAQLVVALKPLHDRYHLKRVVVSTYQSVSGAGAAAVEELRSQTGEVLAGHGGRAIKFKHPIAFNLIPQIGGFLSGSDEGSTSEELKVIQETRKILGIPSLAVSCTAVRVPTLSCHAESVSAEFELKPNVGETRELLAGFPGIEVIDSPENFHYPMNLYATGRDPVYVGRIRKDTSCDLGLQFWVVADNLRKGAALNAIQIAESILA